jgi:DNA-binding response OmpR family regulator
MRVLIVEDEALIRMLLRDVLEEAGFECREAGDAEGAFDVLNEQSGWKPDLLVTDYNLGPGPNGGAVAIEARRRVPGLPVVYATGNPECLAAHDLGARDQVLAKPFASAALIAAAHDATAPASIGSRTLPPPFNERHLGIGSRVGVLACHCEDA